MKMPETFKAGIHGVRRGVARALGRQPETPPTPGEIKNRRYDQEAVEVMRRCLAPDALGVDGGAHVGDFLARLCEIAPQGRHWAFEPLPQLAQRLSSAYPQLRVRPWALGAEAGQAQFCHVLNDPAYSGLRRREYDRPDPEIEQIEVRVVRLDDVLAEDDAPAFIKLDLEGGEYHALLGARRTLERHRPVVVFEAGERSSGHYDVTPEMIHDLLVGQLGYELNTMARWLDASLPLDRGAFVEAYRSEFYFLATPTK